MNKIIYKIKSFFYRTSKNEINYTELKNIVKNNPKAYIIDVRSNQEYIEGHLQNSINIPIYDLEKKVQYNIKNKDEIVILYCKSDKRSKRGKKILENMGYYNVFYLKDGIDGII